MGMSEFPVQSVMVCVEGETMRFDEAMREYIPLLTEWEESKESRGMEHTRAERMKNLQSAMREVTGKGPNAFLVVRDGVRAADYEKMQSRVDRVAESIRQQTSFKRATPHDMLSSGRYSERHVHSEMKDLINREDRLSYRELSIIGASIEQACILLGNADKGTIEVGLWRARKKLREQGWNFVRNPGSTSIARITPPDGESFRALKEDGTVQPSYAEEYAAACLKSRFLHRLRERG
jgi:hypothetical protein